MITTSLTVKIIKFIITRIIFLIIDVISLAYMVFRIICALGKIIFYSVKLNAIKYRNRK